MDVTEAQVIEELLDPLMFSELIDGRPSASMRRLADNAIELDLGEHDQVFVLTVERRLRA